MNDKSNDFIYLLERLSTRVGAIALDLAHSPLEQLKDDTTRRIWRIVLISLSADVSGSIIALARSGGSSHIRALRILDRCLFEHGLRLEYYVHCPEQAISDATNYKIWSAKLVRANLQFLKTDSWSRAKRRQLNEIVTRGGDLEYPKIASMLQQCLVRNGFQPNDAKRRKKWYMSDYYQVASALVHGSQGVFYDFIVTNPVSGSLSYTPKSTRLSLDDALFRSAIQLIGVIMSEEKTSEGGSRV